MGERKPKTHNAKQEYSMSELSTEVKLILRQIDEINRQRVALWRRRERLIARLERLVDEGKTEIQQKEEA